MKVFATRPASRDSLTLSRPVQRQPSAGGGPGYRAAYRVQPKLKIGAPDDLFEREADHVAEKVVASAAPPMVQRKCACSGGTPCAHCADEEGKLAQRQAGPHAASAAVSISDHSFQSLGPGRPLDQASRSFMESRFGHDFSDVRIHADTRAAESAQALKARAYTLGRDIVFGTGEYRPQNLEGRRLLAHELTHVIQQSHSPDREVLQRQASGTPEAASVVDERIDVRAQFAFLRLFKGSPEDSKDATDLFNDVKNGTIKGIYGDDLAAAVLVAGRRGKARWELVPKGQDAILIDDEFDDSPVVIFKAAAGEKPRLDQALLAVQRSRKPLSTTPKTPPPPFKLPPKPRPSPSTPGSSAGCTYSVSAAPLGGVDQCTPPLCGATQVWRYTNVNVQGCTRDFGPGDELVEVVVSDGNCTGQTSPKQGRCAIGAGGTLGRCVDSYGICKPDSQIFSKGSTCTETMTQTLSLGGPFTPAPTPIETHQIVFVFTKTGSGCTTTLTRT